MKPKFSINNQYPEECGVIWVRGALGNFKLRTIGDLSDYIAAVKGCPPKALGAKVYERKVPHGVSPAPHLVADDCLCGLNIDAVCKGYGLKKPANFKTRGTIVSNPGAAVLHYNFVCRFDEDETGKLLPARSMKGLHFLPLPRKLQLHEDLQDHLRRPAVALQRSSRRRKAWRGIQIPRPKAPSAIRTPRARTR